MSIFGEWINDKAEDAFAADDGPDRFPDDEAADRADELDDAIHDWGGS